MIHNATARGGRGGEPKEGYTLHVRVQTRDKISIKKSSCEKNIAIYESGSRNRDASQCRRKKKIMLMQSNVRRYLKKKPPINRDRSYF